MAVWDNASMDTGTMHYDMHTRDQLCMMCCYKYYVVYVLFRNMKVTLKCNRDLDKPKFTADGEKETKQYVSYKNNM